MYPGASNTELCPTRFFTGENRCTKSGQEPDDTEQRLRRREHYWQPYHAALLAAELDAA
jgi:N-formylglutamate deformylase